MAYFHSELMNLSLSYRKLDETKRHVREATQDKWVRPGVILGDAAAYSAHYTAVLRPVLEGCEGFTQEMGSSRVPRRFMDMGCAPGGLCDMLLGLGAHWSGVGVTLSPAAGGLKMDIASCSRLELRFEDVMQHEMFVTGSLEGLSQGSFDLVNMGIVVDRSVRGKGAEVASFSDQLYTQLSVAHRAMKPTGGVLMMALAWDFTTLPEVFHSLDVLWGCSESVRVLPTMYTATVARKQVYVAATGCRLTEDVCHEMRRVWSRGAQRRREYGGGRRKRETPEDGSEDELAAACVKRVLVTKGGGVTLKDVDHFCDILNEALRKLYVHMTPTTQ